MGASMLVADARMSMLSRAVFHMNRITKWHLSLTNCDYSTPEMSCWLACIEQHF